MSQPQSQPFWICHEMRPLMVNDVPHCASCNSEFIEILDSDINPDPRHELPLPPPTRPGAAPPVPPRPDRPAGPPPGYTPPWHAPTPPALAPGARPAPDNAEGSNSGGGLLSGIFNFFGGGGGSGGGSSSSAGRSSSENMPQPPRAPGQQRPQGGRSWEWNLGNGTVRIQGFSGPVPMRNASPFGGGMAPNPFFPGPNPFVGGYAGAPGNPNQGLDAFFHGFGTPPQGRGRAPQGPMDGMDLLQALMAIVMEEGQQPGVTQGQLGDYVMTERGFNDVLERLMQAAGPQGPLPASQETIAGLERFTFDETTLAKSQYKDCPVCMDDFAVGDAAIKIPCGHEFHPDCLVPWLETNGSCPVCRYSLVPSAEERERAQAAGPRGAAGAPAGEAAGDATPQPTATSPLAGAQTAITSVLNRLFGQAGTEPEGSSRPATPSAQRLDPFSDPPDADLPAPDTPNRAAPRRERERERALPEWAQLARGVQQPGERRSAELPSDATAGQGPSRSGDAPQSCPEGQELSQAGASAGAGTSGVAASADAPADPDVTLYRATHAAGDVQTIPWGSPNHQHVPVRYALLGGDVAGEPLLFCHAAPSVGDFSLLQMRRVAGRAEASGERAVEGHVCCHAVPPGTAGEQAMGAIMRQCPGVKEDEDVGAGSTLRYAGPDPSSEIHPHDVD